MVLLINILSRIPQDMVTLYETFVKGKTIARGLLMWIIIAVVIIAVVVLVLILNGAERRIPVQYSKKMAGRKMVGGQSSNIPLKVNTAGVIPIIFASYHHEHAREQQKGIVQLVAAVASGHKTAKKVHYALSFPAAWSKIIASTSSRPMPFSAENGMTGTSSGRRSVWRISAILPSI